MLTSAKGLPASFPDSLRERAAGLAAPAPHRPRAPNSRILISHRLQKHASKVEGGKQPGGVQYHPLASPPMT